MSAQPLIGRRTIYVQPNARGRWEMVLVHRGGRSLSGGWRTRAGAMQEARELLRDLRRPEALPDTRPAVLSLGIPYTPGFPGQLDLF
jgi:hypothetical protein